VTVKFSVVFSGVYRGAGGFLGQKQLYMGSQDARGNWSANYAQPFGYFNVIQRDWHRFYPMNRTQAYEQRAGNPWINESEARTERT
jgi:hypothetical protein